MTKVIALALISALTLFANSGNPPSTPPDQELEVLVLFSGLMVFHERYDTKTYEVGILDQALSEGHEFCVQRLGGPRVCRQTAKEAGQKDSLQDPKYLPTGTKWRILVINQATGMQIPSAGTTVGPAQKKQRRPDVEGGQFDFSWIIDLDGEGFHEKPLELIEGKLKPIIQLPKGEMFTKYKSLDFVRWQGRKPTKPPAFGFAAETIGFRIKLKAGEELVLQEEDDPSKPRTITSVPYVKPSPVGGESEVLTISNTRYPQHDTSDFHMYYKLFRGINESEQFDFDENKTEPCDPPHDMNPCKAQNPAPRRKTKDEKSKDQPIKDTCCGLVCTQVRLVNRKEDLK